ncbi:hypothetical protein Q1695_014327 [Nippostrongylus brasiliensis]|nr:hypothetical protein Q1695_014327 [Nippostrongylus brasiliensis]
MIAVLWDRIAPYGWLITFFCFAFYFFYTTLIKPYLDSIRQAEEVIRSKKFDEDVHARVAAKVEAARLAQQMQHDAVAEEAKRREEQLAKEKLERIGQDTAIQELRKKNVLESTLMSHDLSKLKKSPSNKQRSPAEIIDDFISAKPVVVFSKTWCPFCRKAKAALATFRLRPNQFEYIELDERDDLPGDAIQNEFMQRYGSKSVPKVFINGQLIGGGDDVVRLLHSGELEPLVKAAIQ